MEQEPTVGRIVHIVITRGEEPVPAIITKVWSPSCVNLRVFSDDDRAPFRLTSVEYGSSQPAARPDDQYPYWYWPPIKRLTISDGERRA